MSEYYTKAKDSCVSNLTSKEFDQLIKIIELSVLAEPQITAQGLLLHLRNINEENVANASNTVTVSTEPIKVKREAREVRFELLQTPQRPRPAHSFTTFIPDTTFQDHELVVSPVDETCLEMNHSDVNSLSTTGDMEDHRGFDFTPGVEFKDLGDPRFMNIQELDF